MKSTKQKIEMLALKEAVDDPLEDSLEEDGEKVSKILQCPKCGHEGSPQEFEN